MPVTPTQSSLFAEATQIREGKPQMLATSKDFLRQVLRDFSEDECPSMAAALAYATLFSLPSLLLIVIYIAGLALGPQAASGQIQSRLSGAMGPQAAARIQTMVHNVAQNHTGGLVATALGVARPDTFRDQRADTTSAMSKPSVESKSDWYRLQAFRDEARPVGSTAGWRRSSSDGFGGSEFRDLGSGQDAAFFRSC